MKDTAETIIKSIRKAFAGVPRGAITIHEAEVIDSYGSAEEREEARRLDTESSRDQVPGSDIEQCATALCHLDPEGWRYYIPAYMIWSIQHFLESDSNVSDFTIYTFEPSANDSSLRDHKLARFRLLDDAQSRAVCRFLRYMVENDDFADSRVANEALDAYWGRCCEPHDA